MVIFVCCSLLLGVLTYHINDIQIIKCVASLIPVILVNFTKPNICIWFYSHWLNKEDFNFWFTNSLITLYHRLIYIYLIFILIYSLIKGIYGIFLIFDIDLIHIIFPTHYCDPPLAKYNLIGQEFIKGQVDDQFKISRTIFTKYNLPAHHLLDPSFGVVPCEYGDLATWSTLDKTTQHYTNYIFYKLGLQYEAFSRLRALDLQLEDIKKFIGEKKPLDDWPEWLTDRLDERFPEGWSTIKLVESIEWFINHKIVEIKLLCIDLRLISTIYDGGPSYYDSLDKVTTDIPLDKVGIYPGKAPWKGIYSHMDIKTFFESWARPADRPFYTEFRVLLANETQDNVVRQVIQTGAIDHELGVQLAINSMIAAEACKEAGISTSDVTVWTVKR